jgi:hypothetical protein
MSGYPVTIVESGGMPVSESASGVPMTPTSDPGALPVTIVTDGGVPVTFIGPDFELWPGGEDPTP